MTPQEMREPGSEWCETCKARKKCSDPIALEAATDIAGKPAEICHCYKADVACFRASKPVKQGSQADMFPGAGAEDEAAGAGAEPAEPAGAGFNPNCDAKGKCFKVCESSCEFYVPAKGSAGAEEWPDPGPSSLSDEPVSVEILGVDAVPCRGIDQHGAPVSVPAASTPLRGRDPASAAAGDVPISQSKAERFIAFHGFNPEVYRGLVDIAKELKREGWPRASVRMVLERFRWLYAKRTRGDVHKLNNNFAPYYARLIMIHEPALAGFFDTRALHADELFDAKGVAV